MRYILQTLAVLFTVVACSTTQLTPSSNIKWDIRDSVRIVDSIVPVPIPVEHIVDVVPVYDTLKLETSAAEAMAYVDTLTHTLKGSIENKDTIKAPVQYKTHTVIEYRDVVKTVPVEVEVVREVIPSWCWWLFVIDIAILLMALRRIFRKV